ncbi:MAG: phosphodiesterase [Firmicutes bacterium]|nr:phosphodiesterase [Bacillota bacterium]
MKYFIASDIHGSAAWCRKMLEAFEKEQADRLILLGDVLYHGPRNNLPDEYDPPKVIEMLNPLKNRILAICGNCDSAVDQMVLQFPIMADYAILSLPGEDDQPDALVYLTHGHVWNENHLPPLCEGDILLHGHTHVPVVREHESYTYINPGSVAIPKDGSWHGYMILENGEFIWKSLEGESAPAEDAAGPSRTVKMRWKRH